MYYIPIIPGCWYILAYTVMQHLYHQSYGSPFKAHVSIPSGYTEPFGLGIGGLTFTVSWAFSGASQGLIGFVRSWGRCLCCRCPD